MNNTWLPGKFDPKPASRLEDAWFTFSPLGWEVLPFFALLVPGAVLEYYTFNGYALLGAIGLVVWGVVLRLFLVDVHKSGRVRFWISAPVVLIFHLIFGLFFAGWLS